MASATLLTALAISPEERSESCEADETSREVWEISTAVDWIVSTSVATWPMPARRIAVAPSPSSLTTLRSRRSSASASAESWARSAASVARMRAIVCVSSAIERARITSIARLEDDEDGVQDDHAQAEVVVPA